MREEQINRLMEVVNVLRDVDPTMNLNMVLTLLEVAKGHGINGRDLELKLDLPAATAARLLRVFDRLQKAGKEGLDLFEVRLDPLDYKSKLRYLNDNGKAVMDQIDAALQGKR